MAHSQIPEADVQTIIEAIDYILEDDSMDKWNSYPRSAQIEFKKVKNGKYSSPKYKVKPEGEAGKTDSNVAVQSAKATADATSDALSGDNVETKKKVLGRWEMPDAKKLKSAVEKVDNLSKQSIVGKTVRKVSVEAITDASTIVFGYNVTNKDELEEIKEEAEEFSHRLFDVCDKLGDDTSKLSKAVHSSIGVGINKFISHGYVGLRKKGIELKDTASAIKKFATGEKVSEHEKHAFKATAKEIALAVGAALALGPLGTELGHVIGPAFAGTLHGAELATKAHEITSSLFADVGVDLVKATLTTTAINAAVTSGALGKAIAGAKIGATVAAKAIGALFSDDTDSESESVINGLLMYIADSLSKMKIDPNVLVSKLTMKLKDSREESGTKNESVKLKSFAKFVEESLKSNLIAYNKKRAFRIHEMNATKYASLGYQITESSDHDDLVSLIMKSLGLGEDEADKLAKSVLEQPSN
jgi:hypothetical protein